MGADLRGGRSVLVRQRDRQRMVELRGFGPRPPRLPGRARGQKSSDSGVSVCAAGGRARHDPQPRRMAQGAPSGPRHARLVGGESSRRSSGRRGPYSKKERLARKQARRRGNGNGRVKTARRVDRRCRACPRIRERRGEPAYCLRKTVDAQ